LCEEHGYPTPPLHEFSLDQLEKIRKGALANLYVSVYAKKKYCSSQMKQIQRGLIAEVDVRKYADSAFLWSQMQLIRQILENVWMSAVMRIHRLMLTLCILFYVNVSI